MACICWIIAVFLKGWRYYLYLIGNCLPVCPVYIRGQLGHESWYSPLLGNLEHLCVSLFLPVLFMVLYATPRFCFFEEFSYSKTSFPLTQRWPHYFLLFSLILIIARHSDICFSIFFFYCSNNIVVIMVTVDYGWIIFSSSLCPSNEMGYSVTLFNRNLILEILCCSGWHELDGIMQSAVVSCQ